MLEGDGISYRVANYLYKVSGFLHKNVHICMILRIK